MPNGLASPAASVPTVPRASIQVPNRRTGTAVFAATAIVTAAARPRRTAGNAGWLPSVASNSLNDGQPPVKTRTESRVSPIANTTARPADPASLRRRCASATATSTTDHRSGRSDSKSQAESNQPGNAATRRASADSVADWASSSTPRPARPRAAHTSRRPSVARLARRDGSGSRNSLRRAIDRSVRSPDNGLMQRPYRPGAPRWRSPSARHPCCMLSPGAWGRSDGAASGRCRPGRGRRPYGRRSCPACRRRTRRRVTPTRPGPPRCPPRAARLRSR